MTLPPTVPKRECAGGIARCEVAAVLHHDAAADRAEAAE